MNSLMSMFFLLAYVINSSYGMLPQYYTNKVSDKFVKFYYKKFWSFTQQSFSKELESLDHKLLLQIESIIAEQDNFVLPLSQFETFLIGFGEDNNLEKSLWVQYFDKKTDLVYLKKLNTNYVCIFKHSVFQGRCHVDGKEFGVVFNHDQLPPPDLFPFKESEIRNRSFKVGEDFFYFSYFSGSNMSFLPERLKRIVSVFGIEARLPFDKMMIINNNERIIFYP
ncbi:MAG: hypothetical protein OHK0056_26700 [Bacteriovoracaceae bacterium]